MKTLLIILLLTMAAQAANAGPKPKKGINYYAINNKKRKLHAKMGLEWGTYKRVSYKQTSKPKGR